eukprot:7378856-Prymnesium_polylepis.2
MLCASVLAELEAAEPIEQRPAPLCDVESRTSSITPPSDEGGESDEGAPTSTTRTVSTASALSSDAVTQLVGVPRDFSGHAA